MVDPVFVSKHGHALLAEDAIEALRRRILPLATLVTPNLPEASGLSGSPVTTREDMRRAADGILALGATAVLVKGHLEGDRAADLFADGASEEWIEEERIETSNTHGTGCTCRRRSRRIWRAATLPDAVRAGKAFVTEAIRHALALGGGIGPVDALWSIPPGGQAVR